MIWGADEVFHPWVIRVVLEVDLKVREDSGERLKIGKQALLGMLLLQLWLGMSDQLFNVEYACYTSLNLILCVNMTNSDNTNW